MPHWPSVFWYMYDPILAAYLIVFTGLCIAASIVIGLVLYFDRQDKRRKK